MNLHGPRMIQARGFRNGENQTLLLQLTHCRLSCITRLGRNQPFASGPPRDHNQYPGPTSQPQLNTPLLMISLSLKNPLISKWRWEFVISPGHGTIVAIGILMLEMYGCCPC